MDPITHALVGAVAAKTANTSRRRQWIMAFLGAAPDLDVLANFLGSWAYLFQHRGVSHSVLGIVLQVFFYSALLSRWDRGPFFERTALYAIPIVLHVLCDLMTSFGVPLLLPFQGREFSFDLVNPVTLVPIVFMAGGLLWSNRQKTSGWRATRHLWVTWALYVAIVFSGKTYATRLTTEGNLASTALPSVLNPFQWRAIGLDGTGHRYRHYSVNLLSGTKTAVAEYSRPNGDFPVQASMAAPAVRRFMTESRWPLVRAIPTRTGWRVEWGTLQFSSRGTVRAKLGVDVDSQGNISNVQRLFGFWEPVS